MTGKTDAFINEIRCNLEENILNFWIDRMQDPRGGFYGKADGSGNPVESAPKGVIMNAMIIWAFSAAYRVLKKKEYLMMATRAKDYFFEHFIDHKYGGVYWSLNDDGSRLDTDKYVAASGAAIYGLSEYVKATNDDNVLKYAINLYETTEKEGYDSAAGKYAEIKTRDWHEIQDASDGKDSECMKSSTYIHILEAYTNLYKIWKDESLRNNIGKILDIFTDKIYRPESGHIGLSFKNDWELKSAGISYGYDMEASWLMTDAAFAINDIGKINKVRAAAVKICRAGLEGQQEDGSVIYKICRKCGNDTTRYWWTQAETVTGALWAWKYLNYPEGAEKALACWRYAAEHLVDENGGEWCMYCDAEGKRSGENEKAGMCKSPYHNARMCIEVLEMFK